MNKLPAKDEVEQNEKYKMITRRGFLNTASAAAVGGLVVAAGSSLFTKSEAKATVQTAPPLPWKYTKLDPLEAGKRGYKNYLAKGG